MRRAREYLCARRCASLQYALVDYLVTKGIEGCYSSINPESGDTAGWNGLAYDPVSSILETGAGACRSRIFFVAV